MRYHEMLSKMILHSGMTLREISNKCKERGVKVDPSYISKLQSGNFNPASDEVNKAIAEVCSHSPDELLYAAYLEKAPPMIQDFIIQLLDFFRNTAQSLTEHVPTRTSQVIEQEFINLSDQDLVRRILSQKEILDFLSRLVANRDSNLEDFKESYLDEISKTLLGITMSDNSMEPLIPEGARIHLRQEPFVSGNIYALTVPDGRFLIRRCVFQEGKAILIAEHKTIPPETYLTSDLLFSGRVVSMAVSLE